METQVINFRAMGTNVSVQVDMEDASIHLQEVKQMVSDLEQMMSANNDGSQLMKINHAAEKEKVKTHPILYKLINIGKEHSLALNSGMNIAIGPLVQLWRIGFDDVRIPKQDEIKKVLKLLDINKIQLNEETLSVYLEEEGMKIDLGCIAKGYTADLILEYLLKHNVKSCLINLGGNILVHGLAPNRENGYWRIGIKDPQNPSQNIKIVNIINQSIVTSGIYERTYQGYHHIFDSESGYPVETDVASLSVIAPSSLESEIWTTRLFNLNGNEIINEIKNEIDLECIVIRKDGSIISTIKGEKL